MSDIKFASITDLYNRLLPALQVKKDEFSLRKIEVTELDLWNYLKINIWDKAENLTLAEMVNDILTLDINSYINKEK